MLIRQEPNQEMGRSVRRARKQQRRALRQVRRHMSATNRQYRKATRVERGQDFASTNNATIGSALSGLISKAGDVGSFFATGGASAATMGAAAQAPVVADDLLLPDALTNRRPRWVIPTAVGGGVLMIGGVLLLTAKRSER